MILGLMTKTVLLGITLAVVVGVSMALTAYAFHQPYQVGAVDSFSQGPVLTNIVVTATVPIPAHTTDLAGFAWGVTGSSQATHFGIATHHGVKDSTQRPNQWHTHNLQLGAGAGAAEACIIDIIDNPFAKINVKQTVIDVTLQSSSIDGTLTGSVVPFDIIIEPTCPSFTKVGGVATTLKLGADLS